MIEKDLARVVSKCARRHGRVYNKWQRKNACAYKEKRTRNS
jgi:hypothetical protein